MNKQIKTMITGCLTALALALLSPVHGMVAWAATGQISFSDPSAMAGKEVNVNIEVSASDHTELDRSVVMLSYDTGMLKFMSGTNASGGAGTIQVVGNASDGNSKSFKTVLKFETLKPGSAVISVTDQEVYDSNGQLVDINKIGTSTITIAAQATASDDATLSGLRIAPGELTPAFSPDVENYTAQVGMDQEDIAVSADVANANAKVIVDKPSKLETGQNTVTCKVIAEDGSTMKTYTIAVYKGEDASMPSSKDSPEGIEFHSSSKTLYILPLDEGVEVPEGMIPIEIKVEGQEVTSWTRDGLDTEGFFLLYCKNEKGDKGFYWYDRQEKTLQRYQPGRSTDVPAEKYQQMQDSVTSLQSKYDRQQWIIWALLGVSVLLFAALSAVLIKIVLYSRNSQDHGKSKAKGRENKTEKGQGLSVSREEQYLRGEEPEDEEPDAGIYENSYGKSDEEPDEDEYEEPDEDEYDEDEYEEPDEDEYDEDEYEEPDEDEYDEDEYEEPDGNGYDEDEYEEADEDEHDEGESEPSAQGQYDKDRYKEPDGGINHKHGYNDESVKSQQEAYQKAEYQHPDRNYGAAVQWEEDDDLGLEELELEDDDELEIVDLD